MKKIKIILSFFVVSCLFATFGVSAEDRNLALERAISVRRQFNNVEIPALPNMLHSNALWKDVIGPHIIVHKAASKPLRVRIAGRTEGNQFSTMWLDATPGTQSNFTSSYAAEIGIHNVDIQIVNRLEQLVIPAYGSFNLNL